MEKILNDVGVTAIRMPSCEVFSALTRGYADGAFVGIDAANAMVEEGYIESMYFAEDFWPFVGDVQMLVVGPSAIDVFGKDLADSLRWGCRGVSDDYNAAGVQQRVGLTTKARQIGLDVIEFDSSVRHSCVMSSKIAWKVY